VLEAVLAEFAAPAVGTRALTSALLKQCLVLLLRRRSATPDGVAAWLPVLGDPRLARAVLAMLERPAGPHSLGDLADLAGMGRSAFAGRFSAVLGRPPIEFLKEVRLRRAARLLETTDLPSGWSPSRVGYASRSYFSRAFKELYGTYPAGFRAGGSG
jgi:transcriptional regulator GlxA family with amidase domain